MIWSKDYQILLTDGSVRFVLRLEGVVWFENRTSDKCDFTKADHR